MQSLIFPLGTRPPDVEPTLISRWPPRYGPQTPGVELVAPSRPEQKELCREGLVELFGGAARERSPRGLASQIDVFAMRPMVCEAMGPRAEGRRGAATDELWRAR